MKTCEDCGCRLSDGICSNCDEELHIETYQGEFMIGKTENWDEKIQEQKDRRYMRISERTAVKRCFEKGDTLDNEVDL